MATTISGRIMSAKALTALCALAIAIGVSPSLSQPKGAGPTEAQAVGAEAHGQDAHATTSQPTITPELIDQALKDLHAQHGPQIQAAHDLLWRAGQSAVPALEKAAKGDDAEVAATAKEILADIEWNLFPNTPRQIVNAIRQYRVADAQKKEQLLGEVFSRIGSIMPVVNRIMSRETDETVREKIKELMIANAAAVAPEMIWSGDMDKAQAILEKAAMGDDGSPQPMQMEPDDAPTPDAADDESPDTEPIRHYVAFLLLSVPDKLDATIKELSSAKDKRSATMLALAYRAKGDMQSALKVAKEHNVLLAQLLMEAGDWKALAEHQVGVVAKIESDNSEAGTVTNSEFPAALGKQLAAYRLCGNKEEAQKVVQRLVKAAASTAMFDTNNSTWLNCATQLLGNEYIDQAITILMEHPAGAERAFALLVNQGRFAEAIDLIDKATEQPKDKQQLSKEQVLALKCEAIKIRYRLGQKEEALKKVKAILAEPTWARGEGALVPVPVSVPDGGMVIDGGVMIPNLPPNMARDTVAISLQAEHASQPAWVIREPTASIISLYIELGLNTQAYSLMEDAFKGLSPYAQSQYMAGDTPTTLPGSAAFWWVAISRQNPNMGVKDRMEELGQLLAGKLDPRKLSALAQTAAQMPLDEGPQGPSCGKDDCGRFESLALMLLYYDNFAEAKKYFELWLEKDASDANGGWGGPELEFAMRLIKHGKFVEAAALYDQALTKSTWVSVVAMKGDALVRDGQNDEGQRLIKLGNLMLLADESARNTLAQHFADFGQKELAAKQYELIARLSDPPGNSRSDEPIRFAYAQAMKKKDYTQAARLAEILRIANLGEGSDWTRPEMFLAAAVQAHLPLVREAKAKGDWEKYAAEISACQNALPLANSQPLIDAINDLTKAGKTALADALFDRSWKAGVKTCQDWPTASDYFNSTAWLAVACHRKINEAFNLAQQAVELDKKSPANLDTLAEIYFQKGDRAKAIELCNKCIELDAAATKDAGDAKESKMADYLRRQLKRLQTMDPSTPTPPLEIEEQDESKTLAPTPPPTPKSVRDCN